MAQNYVQNRGSIRWVQTDVADNIIAGSNTGMFASIAKQGVGDSLVTVDDEFRLTPRDVVGVVVEEVGAFPVAAVVERLSETQVRVRTETPAGPVDDAALSLWVRTNFVG